MIAGLIPGVMVTVTPATSRQPERGDFPILQLEHDYIAARPGRHRPGRAEGMAAEGSR